MAKNKFITNSSNGKHNITNRPHFKIDSIEYDSDSDKLTVTIEGIIDFSELIKDNSIPTEWSSLAIVSTNATSSQFFDVKFKKDTNAISCFNNKGQEIMEETDDGNTRFIFSTTKEMKKTEENISTGLQNILFFTGIAKILGNVNESANGRNFASGSKNIAGISDNIIAGNGNEAFGQFGAIFGYQNTGGQATLVAGSSNTVAKFGAGAIGSSNTISNAGDASFACGKNNTITGACVVVGGTGNSITSQGAYSFVCGQNNTACSKSSFICGDNNTIISNKTKGCNFIGGTTNKITTDTDYCLVYGQYLKAIKTGQTIFGKYNETRDDALFIFGNGDSENNRKNALVLTENEELEVKSIILSSEDGTKFRVKVSNEGTLITEKIEVK